MNKNKTIDGGEALLIGPSKNNKIRLAIVSINGRYPKRGYLAVNKNKTEAIFVVSGKIKVTKDGNKSFLVKNETMYFEPGEKYEITGKAKVFVAITPGDAPTSATVRKPL